MSSATLSLQERQALEQILKNNLRRQRKDLVKLLERVQSEWVYTDGMYRFYHQSFKVFGLQGTTLAIVEALARLLPEQKLHPWFEAIVARGTHKLFASEHNADWPEVTAPIAEAFLHAKYFLEVACDEKSVPSEEEQSISSGWAALLTLYGIR